jgi:hypothetical protein
MRLEIRAMALGIAIVVFGLAVMCGGVWAGPAADDIDGGWHFSVTPYLWVPRIDGTLNFTAYPPVGTEIEMSIDPSDYFEHLDFPFMFAADVRKGSWSLATDFFYAPFSGEGATVTSVSGSGGRVEVPIDAGSSTGLTATIWSLVGGHVLMDGRTGTLEFIFGVRYFALKSSIDWRFAAGTDAAPKTGSVSQTADFWDGLVGARGEWRPGAGNWFVPFYVDFGTGTSKSTWSGSAGGAYAFGWGDVRLLYQYLTYDAEEDDLVEKLSLTGPALGVTFHF